MNNQTATDFTWDPLDGRMDTEMLNASAKRSIKNILKSYVGAFDPLSELIQNALDAVDKREAQVTSQSSESEFVKEIWLTIDLKENSFTIVDNGIGFKEEEFKAFLAPSISFKDTKGSRGNKGVGATYIAYGFNHLEMATKSPDFQFSGEIKNGRAWVESVEGQVARPNIKSKQITNDRFADLERGSYFSLRFGGNQTTPKDLSWHQATTAEQWRFLLLTKTPMGNVSEELGNSYRFHLTVIDKLGNITATKETAHYLYPHKVISASKNLSEVRAEQDRIRAAGGDMAQLPRRFTGLNGVFEFFGTEQLKELPSNRIEADERKLIDEFAITAYGFFSYSTTVWDTLNDDVAKLRKAYRVLKGGLQLANNSMIQGDMLVIPLTKSIGYQNQAHILVHFQNADPDLGRKGFQPELKDLSEKIAVGIVNYLKVWRHLLKQDQGNRPDIVQEMNLHEWVKREEDFEKSHPLSIRNPHFFNPINDISISSEPQVEQDAIVLFSQLLAGGVIRGIKLLSTSQNRQYDGLYKFVVTPPAEHHRYDPNTNPLGVLIENYREDLVSKPRVLEYKFCMDALIYEFENGEKHERDVSLVVVWDIGTEWKRHYGVTSLLDIDNLHYREFHGITHICSSPSSGRFDVIVLSELIEYLNNPAQSAANQRSKYTL
jgi:hypothetical protein